MSLTPQHSRRHAAPALLSALSLALLAAGCQTSKVTGPELQFASNYQERHPIRVGEGIATLDLLPGAGRTGLTPRQDADIRGFAANWKVHGRGKLVIEMPAGGASDARSHHAVRAIRGSLAAAGVPAGAIAETRYLAEGPVHLAPVRLMFGRLEARLPHACGQWPGNMVDGDSRGGFGNGDYWNFGCASQQNLAAMVADPEDFVRPRAEDRSYAPRRAVAIGKYRQGESPATTYPQTGGKASDVGQ